MNMRYLVRDRSFLTFLVGGLILVGLAGTGIYLVKTNFKTTDNQLVVNENQSEGSQKSPTTSDSQVKPETQSGSQTQNGQTLVTQNSSQVGGSGSQTTASGQAQVTTSESAASGALPRGGIDIKVVDLLALGITTYAIVALVQAKFFCRPLWRRL